MRCTISGRSQERGRKRDEFQYLLVVNRTRQPSGLTSHLKDAGKLESCLYSRILFDSKVEWSPEYGRNSRSTRSEITRFEESFLLHGIDSLAQSCCWADMDLKAASHWIYFHLPSDATREVCVQMDVLMKSPCRFGSATPFSPIKCLGNQSHRNLVIYQSETDTPPN